MFPNASKLVNFLAKCRSFHLPSYLLKHFKYSRVFEFILTSWRGLQISTAEQSSKPYATLGHISYVLFTLTVYIWPLNPSDAAAPKYIFAVFYRILGFKSIVILVQRKFLFTLRVSACVPPYLEVEYSICSITFNAICSKDF